MIKFKVKKADEYLITLIVKRALGQFKNDGLDLNQKDLKMDITACHANGCALRLEDLLTAPTADFGHDVLGIRRFIDRTTGKIDSTKFDPRCSVPVYAKAA